MAPKPYDNYLWQYKCVARPLVTKAYAVLLGLTSLCLIWGEVVIPVAVRRATKGEGWDEWTAPGGVPA